MEQKFSHIPKYIKARSPLGLRRLMLKVAAADGKKYTFRDIQFVKGFWFAWYESTIEQDDEMFTNEGE